ncbi:DUF6153 family protein [Microbacterium sp.]|uniref:DUF6153 family protein n=1 Tax=Microbacterium sp. TaxID=51671 RepID=UPI003A884C9D
MSLIALRDRVRVDGSAIRTMLLLVALAVAVIAGLLAMHALTTHTAGHTDKATVSAVTASMVDHHDATAGEAGHRACIDCGPGHAEMIFMACVLALMVTVLLLRHPHSSSSWRPPGPVLPTVLGAVAAIPWQRQSRVALCISRT